LHEATGTNDEPPAVYRGCSEGGSEDFTTMRQLAMRFNGLFRERSAEKLDEWLRDAFSRGVLQRHCAKTKAQCKTQ
jgi:hypothetical protein